MRRLISSLASAYDPVLWTSSRDSASEASCTIAMRQLPLETCVTRWAGSASAGSTGEPDSSTQVVSVAGE